MKKIIKLTESDLTNIVKRVIKENDAKDSLIDMIKYDGLESAAELVGGDENLKRVLNFQTPMDYLNLFNDMDVVQSEEKPDFILYRYEKENNILIHYKKNDTIYINYVEIWRFLEQGFELSQSEIKEIIEGWLFDVYNLRGVKPSYNYQTTYITAV